MRTQTVFDYYHEPHPVLDDWGDPIDVRPDWEAEEAQLRARLSETGPWETWPQEVRSLIIYGRVLRGILAMQGKGATLSGQTLSKVLRRLNLDAEDFAAEITRSLGPENPDFGNGAFPLKDGWLVDPDDHEGFVAYVWRRADIVAKRLSREAQLRSEAEAASVVGMAGETEREYQYWGGEFPLLHVTFVAIEARVQNADLLADLLRLQEEGAPPEVLEAVRQERSRGDAAWARLPEAFEDDPLKLVHHAIHEQYGGKPSGRKRHEKALRWLTNWRTTVRSMVPEAVLEAVEILADMRALGFDTDDAIAEIRTTIEPRFGEANARLALMTEAEFDAMSYTITGFESCEACYARRCKRQSEGCPGLVWKASKQNCHRHWSAREQSQYGVFSTTRASSKLPSVHEARRRKEVAHA